MFFLDFLVLVGLRTGVIAISASLKSFFLKLGFLAYLAETGLDCLAEWLFVVSCDLEAFLSEPSLSVRTVCLEYVVYIPFDFNLAGYR